MMSIMIIGLLAGAQNGNVRLDFLASVKIINFN
nr:MAG TPA: hypothetical protein [Caudoviricetes sp.]